MRFIFGRKQNVYRNYFHNRPPTVLSLPTFTVSNSTHRCACVSLLNAPYSFTENGNMNSRTNTPTPKSMYDSNRFGTQK